MAKLTHFDKTGKAAMVDVGAKGESARVAIAGAAITMQAKTFALVKKGDAKKGDVLGVARLAGIMAAKKTPDLIPLCHPLALTSVAVDFNLNEKAKRIDITATCKVTGKTGVEMEALTAASVAALTIYDMLKAADKDMVISDLRLLEKSGGKSGTYRAT